MELCGEKYVLTTPHSTVLTEEYYEGIGRLSHYMQGLEQKKKLLWQAKDNSTADPGITSKSSLWHEIQEKFAQLGVNHILECVENAL